MSYASRSRAFIVLRLRNSPVEEHEEPDHLPGQVQAHPDQVGLEPSAVVDLGGVVLANVAARDLEKSVAKRNYVCLILMRGNVAIIQCINFWKLKWLLTTQRKGIRFTFLPEKCILAG